MDILSSNKSSIGMWSDYVSMDPQKLQTINLSPIQITEDQLIQLYLMLYPMIVADFRSRIDSAKWEKDIHEEMTNILDQHAEEFNSHMHIGNMGANTSPASTLATITIEPWTKHMEDDDYKDAEAYVSTSSTYTDALSHRDPEKDDGMISRVSVPSINEQYSSKLIYVPFDVDSGTDETGDANYAGNS